MRIDPVLSGVDIREEQVMVQMDDRWLWLPGLGRFVFLDDDALAKLTAAAFRQPVLEVAL